jgi:hypothetical protein
MCFDKKYKRTIFKKKATSLLTTTIKHRLKHNSIKMYDKFGKLLRVETTINNPVDFVVYRPKEGPGGELDWRPLRKGLADIGRRAQVSQKANERYLNALASLDTTHCLYELISPICKRRRWKKQWARALNPWSQQDCKLFQTINRGEYMINGFRNQDLVNEIYKQQKRSKKDQHRLSSCVTRKIRLLRAHGLIRKVPRTHRYQLTVKGRKIIPAILESQQLTMNQLNTIAIAA